VIVKKEDIDALVQWVRDNQGKNQKAASKQDWLTWEGRHLSHKAWPHLYYELACSGYGNPDYYQIIPFASFKVRHAIYLELLTFLASECKYNGAALEAAQNAGKAIQGMNKLFERLMTLTKLPQTLKNVYASDFTDGSDD